MKKTKSQKPYWEMTARELAEATKEYDNEIPSEKLRPLSKKERERWERSKEQPSRSIYILNTKRGGIEPLLVELDGALIREMDIYVRDHHLTRKELIERALRGALAVAPNSVDKRKARRSA